MRDLALVGLGALLGLVPAAAIALRIAALARGRRRREEALRHALEARLWADRVRGAAADADPAEARRRRHELNNALSTALLSAQFLNEATRDEAGRSKPMADQNLAAGELVDALQRMKRLVEPPRSAATTTSPQAPLVEPAELPPAAQAAVARAAAAHPRVSIGLAIVSPALGGARVAVCGGAEGLARVLDALLANACEGDGVNPATSVSVRVGAEGEFDVVRVEISDDGPGFSRAQLGAAPEPFAGTKRAQLGLGLATAESILAASGGSLRRENAGKGARVTAFLLAAAESGASPRSGT
ncbi:MAG TPA: HAMP domain-containing sensor histidine kinase [Myxococcota bacterium]|nr:HAMP domain-containing sensor histidine kinase [Myxococcota bacterium]